MCCRHNAGVPTAADLLDSASPLGLRLLGGPGDGPGIRDVTAIESLAAIAGAARGSLVVVLQAASSAAPSYELDVAVRRAADRGLAALLLAGRDHLPVTSVQLAERARLPVLAVEPGRDVAELVLRIDRVIRGGAAEVLARASDASRVACDGELEGDPESVLAAVSAALGTRVWFDDGSARVVPGGRAADVHVHGRVVGRLQVDHSDEAAGLVLPVVAAVVGRLRQAELERRFAPAQTRAELLAQILVADRDQLATLAEQARDLGLPVEQTHVAVWLRVRTGDGTSTRGLIRQRRLLDTAELTALQVLPGRGAMWHVARLGGSLLLLCTSRAAGVNLSERAGAEVQRLLDTLLADDVTVHAGVGTPQPGVEGIRQTAIEARAATESAVSGHRPGVVVGFDATGLRRVLADVYSSPLSRHLIAELLAPLDRQGPARSRQAILTLAAYLDAQSSPSRAAVALHLHPNAVSYRIRQITAVLGVDLADPDTRFTLHLACRARLLDR